MNQLLGSFTRKEKATSEDHMASRDPAKSRANTLATKIWQTTQSNATKTENLENDFEELSTDTTESLDGLVKRTTQELGSKRPEAEGFKETTSQAENTSSRE